MNLNLNAEVIWLIIGFSGQLVFGLRFLLQWLKSEKEQRSVIPVAFWYCSIVGGLMLFLYACYKRDPVFILGQAFGIVVYSRNLYFIMKYKNKIVEETTK